MEKNPDLRTDFCGGRRPHNNRLCDLRRPMLARAKSTLQQYYFVTAREPSPRSGAPLFTFP